MAVVAPAGDLGPEPQSILGIAGLPEVVTVGAADRDGVAASSAGRPSVFGRVKPDLVAPAGIGGLVSDGSALAGRLDLAGPAAPGASGVRSVLLSLGAWPREHAITPATSHPPIAHRLPRRIRAPC